MAYYKDLREYLNVLDKAGKLITINSPINKDTELQPLVRLQFRGLPEEQRKAFLFTNVYDSRGIKYDIPVVLGALAGSSEIYALGAQCKEVAEITEKLAQAQLHPIEPVMVDSGPAQEVVYMGDNLLEKGGLDEFPVPIGTPGWDAGPISSAPCWVSKDPENGIRNVGIYRSQLYAQDRMGIHLGSVDQHLQIQWQKARAKGIPLQVAIVVGGPPNQNYVGSTRLPFEVDEYAVAGGIAGKAVELVKCKTVDVEVPANADIIIEGEMNIEELEMEAPHGEHKGYMGMEEMQPYLTVKCITHRKNPIWLGIISQTPPSESSKMAQHNSEGTLFRRLRYDLNMDYVLEVGYHDSIASAMSVVPIKMKMHTDQNKVWHTLEEVTGGKVVVAVDEDINIKDADMIWWAIGGRSQPHRDTRIVKYESYDMRSSSIMPEDEMVKLRHRQFDKDVPLAEASRLLINATLKWGYPPIALPKKEYMEGAKRIWEKEGLPALTLKDPWYGFELGHWPKQFSEDAERAVRGEYYKTSEMRARNRIKLDNSEWKAEGER